MRELIRFVRVVAVFAMVMTMTTAAFGAKLEFLPYYVQNAELFTSDDASTIAFTQRAPDSELKPRVMTWNREAGLSEVSLGDGVLTSHVKGISADGTRVLGLLTTRETVEPNRTMFVRSSSQGTLRIGDTVGGGLGHHGRLTSSDDLSVIVFGDNLIELNETATSFEMSNLPLDGYTVVSGNGLSVFGETATGFARWTKETGPVHIGGPDAPNASYLRVWSSSFDGSTVGFWQCCPMDVIAEMWTARDGFFEIHHGSGTSTQAWIKAISADGTKAVTGTGLLWREDFGTVDVRDLLLAQGVSSVQRIAQVEDMTPDGLYLVGRADETLDSVFIAYLGVGQTLGDTDNDGDVDLADLNNVRNNFGGAGLGDTEGNGTVDLADLNNVRNHFGESVPVGNPVPEPAAFGMTLVALVSLVAWRRKHRQR